MNKNISLLIILFLFIYCSFDDYSAQFQNIKVLRSNKEHREAIKLLNAIHSAKNVTSKSRYKAHFLIAEILLNDFSNYELAILEFKKLEDGPISNVYRKKSMFMISYIYHNNLHQYTDALIYYKKFINQYPDDDLVESVKYEIDSITNILNYR